MNVEGSPERSNTEGKKNKDPREMTMEELKIAAKEAIAKIIEKSNLKIDDTIDTSNPFSDEIERRELEEVMRKEREEQERKKDPRNLSDAELRRAIKDANKSIIQADKNKVDRGSKEYRKLMNQYKKYYREMQKRINPKK
mgnify:CR=1 FL=1